MRPVVVLSEPIHEAGLAVLRAAAEVLVLQQSTPAILRRAMADADAVIVRLSPLDAEIMAAAPRLRVIGRHGAGLDNVDLAAATRRNIPVVFVPEINQVVYPDVEEKVGSIAPRIEYLKFLLGERREPVNMHRSTLQAMWVSMGVLAVLLIAIAVSLIH